MARFGWPLRGSDQRLLGESAGIVAMVSSRSPALRAAGPAQPTRWLSRAERSAATPARDETPGTRCRILTTGSWEGLRGWSRWFRHGPFVPHGPAQPTHNPAQLTRGPAQLTRGPAQPADRLNRRGESLWGRSRWFRHGPRRSARWDRLNRRAVRLNVARPGSTDLSRSPPNPQTPSTPTPSRPTRRPGPRNPHPTPPTRPSRRPSHPSAPGRH